MLGNIRLSLVLCLALAAAAGHLLIYAFYLVAERPFVRSRYTMLRSAQTVTSAPQ